MEIWREIEGFPGYLISSEGRILGQRNKKPMLPIIYPQGYLVISFYKGGNRFQLPIHDLVLTTFKGSRPEGMVAFHKDGNQTNNKLDNLEWVDCRFSITEFVQNIGVKTVNDYKEIPNFPNYFVNSNGDIWSSKRKKFLCPSNNCKGYKQIKLCKNGKEKWKLVHHLVLETFICSRPEGKEANHKDGNKKNNKVENLEWVSPSENVRHAISNNFFNLTISKLTEESVVKIRKLDLVGYKISELCEMFEVSKRTINSIIKRKTWGWVE